MQQKFDAIKAIKECGELETASRHKVVLLSPLSNESKLLESLSLSPGDCRSCDLYWAHQNKVYFVGIELVESESLRTTYSQGMTDEHRGRISVFTEVSPITLEGIDRALDYMAVWLEQRCFSLNQMNPEHPVIVTNIDICK